MRLVAHNFSRSCQKWPQVLPFQLLQTKHWATSPFWHQAKSGTFLNVMNHYCCQVVVWSPRETQAQIHCPRSYARIVVCATFSAYKSRTTSHCDLWNTRENTPLDLSQLIIHNLWRCDHSSSWYGLHFLFGVKHWIRENDFRAFCLVSTLESVTVKFWSRSLLTPQVQVPSTAILKCDEGWLGWQSTGWINSTILQKGAYFRLHFAHRT